MVKLATGLALALAGAAMNMAPAAADKITINAKSNLLIFGDSYSDIGNTARYTNVTYLWHGRFSNSYVWDEYTAPLLDSTLINHAYANGTSNNDFAPNYYNGVLIPTVHDNVDKWLESTCPSIIEQAYDHVSVEIGINDVLVYLDRIHDGTVTIGEFAAGLLKTIDTEVQKLVKAGYKNVYVWNLPPIDTYPVIKEMGLSDTANKIVAGTNAEFERYYGPGKSDHVRLLNMFNIFEEVMKPEVQAAMGITNIEDNCYNTEADGSITHCDDPYAHLWSDKVHPSTRVHYLWGAIAAKSMRDPTFEINTENVLSLVKTFKINEVTLENNLLINGISEEERAAIPESTIGKCDA